MFAKEMIMMDAHPQKSSRDRTALVECISACLACEQACTACADACLSEQLVDRLRACIRLNQDCAEICSITARSLSRLTAIDVELVNAEVALCALACRKCGEECQRHSSMHEHCRVCAESCQTCEQACAGLLGPKAR